MNTQGQDEGFQPKELKDVPAVLGQYKGELPPLLEAPPASEASPETVPPVVEMLPEFPAVKPLIQRIGRGIYSAAGWCFGMLSLIGGLSVISVIPIVNLLSLGYLLHVSATIARTGRLRDGFIGVRRAGQLGGIVLGIWLVLWPARFIALLRDSAVIVDPQRVGGWSVGMWIVTTLISLHIIWALLRGGKLRHFFWPAPIRLFRWLGTPDKFTTARDAVWETAVGLRLPELFWLGTRGFAGTVLWLLIPVVLMILASKIAHNAGVLVSLLGGVLLMGVLFIIPFQQVWFARENRFRAFIESGPRVPPRGPRAVQVLVCALAHPRAGRAVVPVKNRTHPGRNHLAPSALLRGLRPARPIDHRLGNGPRRTTRALPQFPAAMVLPIDRLGPGRALHFQLRGHPVFLSVHFLERHSQPPRTTRLPRPQPVLILLIGHWLFLPACGKLRLCDCY